MPLPGACLKRSAQLLPIGRFGAAIRAAKVYARLAHWAYDDQFRRFGRSSWLQR